mmetsp:Transcript_5753/g.5375  ORF Transcript_5753/g.5375 Transcript_5753/m.5375 type:complete len:86 (+) Transcript_5753:573-830(+)
MSSITSDVTSIRQTIEILQWYIIDLTDNNYQDGNNEQRRHLNRNCNNTSYCWTHDRIRSDTDTSDTCNFKATSNYGHHPKTPKHA